MLFPLPEPRFLQLDLLRKPLPQQFLLFLELGVIQLLDLCFPEFTRLHLRLAVGFVVRFFGGGDEVEHVYAEEEGSEFAEITVVLVVD
jgi:hypothetical protein